ncbi:hypothetical protein AURDEDRAFT_115334 [Auricularia subglabra TFB-10046 SS5]|nr:hypothetical protein AURDEDRAFT_115334 [Auricularia subglabra TFB-10046 SS5]
MPLDSRYIRVRLASLVSSLLHMAEAAIAQLIAGGLRAEHATRKEHKKRLKTACGRCGGTASASSKLQTCSRCNTPRSQNTSTPRTARTYRGQSTPSSRRPRRTAWGCGSRAPPALTPSLRPGSLQLAYEPVDLRATPSRDGPPSFQRWAKPPGGKHKDISAMMKYHGATLLGLRAVVQNRRRDGRVVVVATGHMRLALHAQLKDNLLPEDLERAHVPSSRPGTPTVVVPAWTDYNGLVRTAILELNGVEAPAARFDGTDERPGEYLPPARPSGAPWERVIDWAPGSVMLAPGDYVVFACQYRVGDGHRWTTVPQILSLLVCAMLPACRSDIVPADAARRDAALLAAMRTGGDLVLNAPVDREYFVEYYWP